MIAWGLFFFISSHTTTVSGLLLHDVVDDQVLVLRTAGKVGRCISDVLVPRYADELSKANVRFSVLHYGTKGDWRFRKTTSSNVNAHTRGAQELSSHVFRPPGGLESWEAQISHEIRSFSILHPNVTGMNMEATEQGIARERENIVEFSVSICYVDWKRATKAYPLKHVSSYFVHYIHDQNVALWHRYCMQDISPPVNEQFAKIWFVESDAIFGGKVAPFIEAHSALKDDLVATGLRIAGTHWWKVKKGLWKTGEPYVKKFWNTSKAVRNLETLPSLNVSKCRNPDVQDEHGFLFFQDHVMRLSIQLLNILSKHLQKGIIGPSESWLPTLCASDTSCSIYDFEPQHLNSSIGPNTWVADSYCWTPTHTNSTLCDKINQKWFHPYKCDEDHQGHLPKCAFREDHQ